MRNGHCAHNNQQPKHMSDITTTNEEVKKLVASVFTKIQERDNLMARIAALNLELKEYGLDLKDTSSAGTDSKSGGLTRLKGDKKDNIKPIIKAIVSEHKKGIKRADIEKDVRITAYLQGIGYTGELNLLSVLSEMVKDDKTIKGDGEKQDKKYLPV